jgi:hypothetical protein
MPQQLSSQDVLRELRRVRYSSRKGRRLGLTWIACQTGYQRESLYRAIRRGWVSSPMADRLSAFFRQTVTFSGGHTALASTLGPLDDGPDPRGGPRPVRRPDDRRLPAARLLRGRSRGNASLGPYGGGDDHAGGPGHSDGHDRARRPTSRPDARRLRSARASGDTSGAPYGARPENPHPCDHYGGGTVQIGPRGAGRPSQHTPPVTGTLDAVEHVLEQGPTNQVTIRIDFGRLLTKQLDSSQNRRGGSDFKARRP